MFTNPDQFATATKTLFDLQMQTFDALANKAVQGVQQVVALNMSTAKKSMEGTLAAGKDISAARDPQAALAAMQARIPPGMAGAQAYGEELKSIINEIHTDFRHAADTHLAEARSTVSALIYDVTQHVKPGSENAVQIVKAAIDNAFQGYERVTQATRTAIDTVEQQVAKASEQVATGMGKAAKTE